MSHDKHRINETNRYSDAEICPICGRYTPEGQVCDSCLKQHDLYEPKVQYIKI